MDKYKILGRIANIYADGGNILEYLRDIEGHDHNSIEDIMISYDFQAGSYNSAYKKTPDKFNSPHEAMAEIMNGCLPENGYTLCEAGVGEGTSFFPLIPYLRKKPAIACGFDISWSRILETMRFGNEFTGLEGMSRQLVVGDMFEAPFADNSFDIVYTSHAMEPNGGKEAQMLAELYRITSKYLFLFEPIYELASEEVQKRMIHHGYVRGLKRQAEALGYSVVRYEILRCFVSDLNPTGVLVIEKGGATEWQGLCDPLSKKRMTEYDDCYFCKDSMLSYPKIGGIPCLSRQNAVLTTKFETQKV